ncbi:shikimate dehydrogenase [Jannaschia ovalis]|uniref:Shikimate dehydrogenase (NADP(+)) n=1 Tax=Jannaschia ovalis TaxID=3038773 RepID=A0ABY8LG64_9RHOB|nr:shikimate dehydrogenase [Jannaschia sp. GRR-S6-38]WGH80290.1 shikimate dehydrogenase [Jannaschia sp. GRR-S6-38]
MTILAGVIGDPIGHSRSPRLHGHWLRRYGIDGQYVPLHVRPADLEATLRLLPRIGFAGINVTLPHKEAVFALADTVTDRARSVEAANTLSFRDGGIHADNTDGIGFIASLRQGAPGWPADRPAVVLGAGGAARGIVAALLDAGVPHVRIANRTAARAEALAARFPAAEAIAWDATPAALADCGLLVNTTSLGMAGQPPLEIALDDLAPEAVVTDIVYAPLVTDLLARAAARGNPTVDGLGMLLHQAAPGFAAWFGATPEVDDALRRAVLG